LGLANALVRAASAAQAPSSRRGSSPLVSSPLVSSPLGLELGTLTDAEAVAWAQQLEQLNRHLQGLLVQAAGELSNRMDDGRYEESESRTPGEFLSTSLRLSRAESARRLRLASRFLPTTDALTKVTAEATQPVLGSALFSGRVSAEQAAMISGFVDAASRLAAEGTVPENKVRELEQNLTGHAEAEPPEFLRRLGVHAMALLDPDGQKPSESELLAKQGIFFRRQWRGMVRIDGHLTIRQYEHLMAGIGWATSPRVKDVEGADAEQADDKRADVEGADTDEAGLEQQANPARPGPDQLEFLTELLNVGRAGQTTQSPRTQQAPQAQQTPPVPQAPQKQQTPPVFLDPRQPLWTPSTGDDGSTWLKPPPAAISPWASPGWPQPLAPQGLPAPPPGSPPHAIPPRFFDDKWFWIPDLLDGGGPDNGWATPSQAAEGPWALGPAPDWPPQPEGDGAEPWPRLVDGVLVPEPGSDAELEGLNPIDPNRTDPAVQDRRTRGQRLLDGLINCVRLASRTDKLPLNGGLKSQLYLSTSQEDLDQQDGAGTVLVPYSGRVPLALFEEDLCDADVTQLLRDSNGGILDVGRTQRLFTFAQRKILAARDMGCAYPDCMAPPQWAEAHHIRPWKDGGVTSVDNGVLCCSLHHHYLHERGWTVRLVGGTAWFTPPYCDDITRTERRNTYHRGMS